VGKAKLKIKASDFTTINCDSRTPSVLKITNPFFGHKWLINTAIVPANLKEIGCCLLVIKSNNGN